MTVWYHKEFSVILIGNGGAFFFPVAVKIRENYKKIASGGEDVCALLPRGILRFAFVQRTLLFRENVKIKCARVSMYWTEFAVVVDMHQFSHATNTLGGHVTNLAEAPSCWRSQRKSNQSRLSKTMH